MGYDMYVVRQPEPVAEAYKGVVEGGTSEDYLAWSVAQDEHNSYWRESIWSMGRFRAVLDALGCLDVQAVIGPRMESDEDHRDRGRDQVQMYRLIDNSSWVVSDHQCSVIAEVMDEWLSDPVAFAELALAYAGEEVATGGFEAQAKAQLGALIQQSLEDGYSVQAGNLTPTMTNLEYALQDLPSMLLFFQAAAKGGGFYVS